MFNFVIYATFLFTSADAVKCYSCASTNMQENFLTKQRGPANRMSEPKVFSDDCQSNTWVIKDRSSDDCGQGGFCFKWQQGLNNSGSYTYMTFRGCYNKLYNLNDPNSFKPPNHSFCTSSNAPLTCLSDASVIEDSCWCQGDYCNSARTKNLINSLFIVFLISFLIF